MTRPEDDKKKKLTELLRRSLFVYFASSVRGAKQVIETYKMDGKVRLTQNLLTHTEHVPLMMMMMIMMMMMVAIMITITRT